MGAHRRLAAILSLFSSWAPALAAADATAPGDGAQPDIASWQAKAKLEGRFDRTPSLDRNMINAPADRGPPPPPLAVSDEKLRILNGARERIGNEVLLEVGLRPPSTATRTVEVALCFGACGNGLGGHYGGLDVTVRWKGIGRDPDADSFGFATVALAEGDKAQYEALHAAISRAVRSSLASFRATLGLPIHQVALRMPLAGFSPEQRKRASGLLRCAAELVTPVTPVALTEEPVAVVAATHYRIGRYHPGQTPRDFAADLASQIEGQLRDGFMARCRLDAPFAGYSAKAAAAQSPTGEISINVLLYH